MMRRLLEPTSDCPPLDELVASTSAPSVQLHLQSCAHCQNELAMFSEFSIAEIRPSEIADVNWVAQQTAMRVKAEIGPAPWWKTLFALHSFKQVSLGLATLLLAISGVLYNSRTSTAPVFPGELPTASTLRATSIQLIEPIEDINVAPSSFSWQELTNCSDYQVIVSEVDRMQIWSNRVPKSGMLLPADLKKQVLPGKTLLWKVIAYDAAGKKMAESETRKFRVTLK